MMPENRKAALITGCNGGIGKALCREFSTAGYFVIGTDLHMKMAADCGVYLRCDLAGLVTKEEFQLSFQTAVCDFVNEQAVILHVVINNAAYQVVKQLDKLSVSDFQSVQTINVTAPFVLSSLFNAQLRQAGGAIINIGSVHSRLTKPGFCAYSTSKAALAGLTRALALEFSGEVTVNTILPGATKTEMLSAGFADHPEKLTELESYHPVGRIADPVEIARLALYLSSADARFINGAEVPIDGGICVRLHDPV